MWWDSLGWSGRAPIRSPTAKRWFNRRLPPASSVRMSHRNIFILPTRIGLVFTLMMLLILIAAINYQNALAHALAFLMLGIFLVAMLQTYRNLSGLLLRQLTDAEGFSGSRVDVPLQITTDPGRKHEGIVLFWPDQPDRDMVSGFKGVTRVVRSIVPNQRGWYQPERLRLETVYPLGLFRAWSWLDLNWRILSFPKPVIALNRPPSAAVVTGEVNPPGSGNDDFSQLRDYVSGDDQRHIHWRASAKMDRLIVKEFTEGGASNQWLRLDDFREDSIEVALGKMAYWVQALTRQQLPFGLDLFQERLEVNNGPEHERAALRALALHGIDPR